MRTFGLGFQVSLGVFAGFLECSLASREVPAHGEDLGLGQTTMSIPEEITPDPPARTAARTPVPADDISSAGENKCRETPPQKSTLLP